MINKIYAKLYRIARYLRNKLINSSASSDDGFYPNFCLKASQSEITFEKFKRNIVYNQVLEHVSEIDGWKYQKEIDQLIEKSNLKKYKKKLFTLAALNDSIGGPRRCFFNSRYISPTSLRYIKVTLDILELIKDEKII